MTGFFVQFRENTVYRNKSSDITMAKRTAHRSKGNRGRHKMKHSSYYRDWHITEEVTPRLGPEINNG
jgi:hypothetical protein